MRSSREVPAIKTRFCVLQPGEDPFSKMKQERKQRVAANEGRQLANSKYALKHGGKGAVPNTLKLAATLPEHGKGQPTKRKELRSNVRHFSCFFFSPHSFN